MVDQVAYDLLKGGYNTTEKPVVFIGSYELNPAILEKCSMGSDIPGYAVIKDLNDWMEEENRGEICLCADTFLVTYRLGNPGILYL